MCPRCGGDLQSHAIGTEVEAEAGRSFASFLQPGTSASASDQQATPPICGEATDPATAPTEPLPGSDIGAELQATPAATAVPEQLAPAAFSVASPQTVTPVAAIGSSPSFLRTAVAPLRSARSLRWQWLTLIGLALLLLLQVVIADRARLAADPGWRPALTRLCGVLGCSLPDWHQPEAFTMLSRDVRPLPGGAPGNLQVEATFRNDAPWPQAWPQLLLSFSDADGRVVGARAFTPAEYLGKPATGQPLPPGQSARISLNLREPGPEAVAFSFDFH